MTTTLRPGGSDTERPVVISDIEPDDDFDADELPPPPIFRLGEARLAPHVEVDADADPELRVEPKLRARRIEVRHAARRHRRRVVTAIVVAVVLIGGLAGAVFSPLLDLDTIDVTGADHVGAATVIEKSGLNVGDRLVDIDLDAARERIERLGWVRQARLERRWPDTVRIRITERAPVATVTDAAGNRLVVTTGGWITGRASGFDNALPSVVVSGLRPRVGIRVSTPVARAVEMVGAMPATILVRMKEATVSESGELIVRLTPNGEVWFGRAEDVRRKFLSAETVLGGAVDVSGLCRLDVRSAASPTLLRGATC